MKLSKFEKKKNTKCRLLVNWGEFFCLKANFDVKKVIVNHFPQFQM